MKNILSKINCCFLFFSVFILFLGRLFLTLRYINLNEYSIILYSVGGISFFLAIINFIKNKFYFEIGDFFVVIMIILGIIATLLSEYKIISIFGQPWRGEGLLAFISYYFIFLISTFIKKEKHYFILHTILIIGVFEVFYGVLQLANILPNVFDGTKFAGGLVGNSNLFGAQNAMYFAIAIGLLIHHFSFKNIFFTFIFLCGIFMSGSMSSFVALFVIFSLSIFYLIKTKQIKKLFIPCITGIVLLILVNSFFNNKLLNDVKTLSNQVYDIIVNKNLKDNYGTNRMFIWKYTLEVVPKYALHGVGIDCFMYAFPQEKNTLPVKKIVDKAHNEILQFSVTQGIITAFIYLMFIIYSVIKCFKNKDKNYLKYPLLFSILAFFIQSQFTISVNTVTPIFYLLLGLSHYRSDI